MVRQGLGAYLLLGVEPELDCWDSAAARNALAEADFVVSLSAYRTAEMEGYADVLLPIGPFAETSGTLVNAEGRWQSFEAAVTAAGEARPGWKVLRVLGNMLGLGGFEYMVASEIRDEVRALLGSARPDNGGAWRAPEEDVGQEGKLVRIGEVPIYAVDPLVRRGTALQATADAHDAAVYVNGALAKKMGLGTGDMAAVTQGENRVTLRIVVDARLPDGCALVPAGVAASAGLGPMVGELHIGKVH
jgi:NADH-quinone oxidoreductase subunit G